MPKIVMIFFSQLGPVWVKMTDVVLLNHHATLGRAIVIQGLTVCRENVAAQIAINPNSHPLTALMIAVVSSRHLLLLTTSCAIYSLEISNLPSFFFFIFVANFCNLHCHALRAVVDSHGCLF